MASRRKQVAKAVPLSSADLADLAHAARGNPYVQRLIEDQKLRDNITTAIDASKRAYDRLLSSKHPHKAIIEDKKLHKEVRTAAEGFRDAGLALAAAPKKAKKGRRLGRKLMILTIGAAAALVGSETLRSKVLDTLFGAEEEFQYTPPASAPAAAPASPVTAA